MRGWKSYQKAFLNIFYFGFVLLISSSCSDKEQVPAVSTFSVFMSPTLVTSGCQVKSDGSSPVTALGVCWSTQPNPTIQDQFTKSTPGAIKSSLDTLKDFAINTTYYVKAYATNSAGTGYGEQVEATLYLNHPEADVTDVDGNTYNTIRIGTQIWMKENLKTTHYRNGDPIPNISDDFEWSRQTSGAYCDYKNDPSISNTYGRLYNSYVMTDTRKIAPTGWRVPGQSDWLTLMDFLGDHCHDHMQEAGSEHWKSANTTADNASGFTALPSGQRDAFSSFKALGYQAIWWNLVTRGRVVAMGADNKNNCGSFGDGGGVEISGYSIRCIKEE
jgi:uncharacterized protein (TIGR02145 family)